MNILFRFSRRPFVILLFAISAMTAGEASAEDETPASDASSSEVQMPQAIRQSRTEMPALLEQIRTASPAEQKALADQLRGRQEIAQAELEAIDLPEPARLSKAMQDSRIARVVADAPAELRSAMSERLTLMAGFGEFLESKTALPAGQRSLAAAQWFEAHRQAFDDARVKLESGSRALEAREPARTIVSPVPGSLPPALEAKFLLRRQLAAELDELKRQNATAAPAQRDEAYRQWLAANRQRLESSMPTAAEMNQLGRPSEGPQP